MTGRPSDWARWLLILAVAILAVRLAFHLLLPFVGNTLAWLGAVMLGLALVFIVLPLPHEATLGGTVRRRPPPPADTASGPT